MSIPSQLIRELFAPMLREKHAAITSLRAIAERRASRSPSWWAWTVWLAHAITAQKIENA